MERIERALEVARLHRHRMAEAGAAPFVAEAAVAEVPPPSPVHLDIAAGPRPSARIEDAPLAQIASRDELRERYVIFPDEPGSAALAYKMLRTQVLQRARQHGMRCIGVISAANGEGKTVTAVNLALSLAADPAQSVILVDLDLRRPSIAGVLGIVTDQGIEKTLTSESPESALRRCAGVERLAILPALAPLPDSAEILAGHAATALMKALRAASGEPLIVVDLPPALLSADVLAFAPQLDAVVLVVTEERTRREDLQRVFELLRATPVLGTVLNASSDAEKRNY